METHILRSKLFSPVVREGIVNRPGLLARLEEGLRPGVRLVLLSAPAGFGKTTLAGEWLLEIERRTAKGAPAYRTCWLTLDERDNHLGRFLRYLIALIHDMNEPAGQMLLEWLQMPYREAQDQILAGITNELALSSRPIILFLDDYHLIESDEVHHCVGFLLEHLPAHVHLVIMTRSDPPLPLARLRGRGQMIELRAADLRFTHREIESLFNDTLHYHLGENQIAAVEERTEGWITALQLLGLSIQGKTNQAELIEAFTGSNRYILDYLMEEVLGGLPQDIQDFLLVTSLLKRLRAELCDALTGRKDSHSILEHLEKDDLFLVPLDNERIWFRYHLLFGEFLRNRLHERSEDGWLEKEQAYHRRAAAWLHEHACTTEAIEQAFLAGDETWAADLIEESTRSLYIPGEISLLLGWLERLSYPYLLSRPRLCMAYAWALLMSGRITEIQPYLDIILRKPEELDPEITGEVAVLRTLMTAYTRFIPAAITYAQEALVLLPEDNTFLRSLAYHNLGVAYEFLDESENAYQAYENGWHLAKMSGMLILKILNGTQLGDVRYVQGRLHESETRYIEVFDSMTETEKNLPLSSMVFLGLGRLFYEWNRIDEAEKYFQQSVELSRKWEVADFLAIGLVYLLKVTDARRDWESSARIIDQIDEIMVQPVFSSVTVNFYRIILVHYWLRHGEIDKAAAMLVEVQISDVTWPHAYIIKILGMARARLNLTRGEAHTAVEILEETIGKAEKYCKSAYLIELNALLAIALQAQGEISHACDILNKTLIMAENEHFVRSIIDEGQPMLDLMREMEKRSMLPKYGERLVAVLAEELKMDGELPKEKNPHPEGGIEYLSERELEVLQLITQGYTNQEIADKLYVAISTIKTHVGNIYTKMGVKSRVQAAARAREFNL